MIQELREGIPRPSLHHTIHTIVLYGLPGMGKSQLAAQFGIDYCGLFSSVWRINCRTEEQCHADYRKIAEDLGIPISKETPSETIKRRVHLRLEADGVLGKPALIIFDNVSAHLDREQDVPQKGCVLLVATTNKETCLWANQMKAIGPFDEEESIKLLTKTTKEPVTPEMRSLAKRLGYFPLAINLAGQHIGSGEFRPSKITIRL